MEKEEMDDAEFAKKWLEEEITITRKELYEKENAAYARGYAAGTKNGEAGARWEHFNNPNRYW